MATHVKVLGVIYLTLSAAGLLVAGVILLGLGGVVGIVGASADPEEAALAIPIIGIAGTALAALALIVSLPGLLTGIGLLYFRQWARVVGIVLAALYLLGFPWFTILGVYGLWVLLSKDSERLFEGPSTAITPAR